MLSDLGIPADYGLDPYIPSYSDTDELIDVEPNIVGHTQRLAPDTAAAWRELRQAALDDDVEILLVSGFRSYDDQAALFRTKLAKGHSIDEILSVNAAPGYSQHHTGRAIDVATPGCRPLTEEFEHTRAFAWLMLNAEKFDFRMPYGHGNPYGFAFEPWHWSQLAD